MNGKSLQVSHAPMSTCFGCGPANEKGLQIRSFPKEGDPERTTCDWTPSPEHRAFPGVLNGGIIGSLLDCHSNWTAAYLLMRKEGLSEIPSTVTADFHVFLLRPTPIQGPVRLEAWAKEIQGDRVLVEAELFAGGKRCARCEGTFVSVKPGHPAYHRWN